MVDVILDRDGDMVITQSGDIRVGESITQDIKIRLKWFLAEWRWNRKEGLPYWESLLIKNPDTESFLQAVRQKIASCNHVLSVEDVTITVDPKTRKARIDYTVYTTRMNLVREGVLFDV